MKSQKFDFLKQTCLPECSAVIFYKQFLAYTGPIDCCYIMLSINIQVSFNIAYVCVNYIYMHIYVSISLHHWKFIP